MLIQLESDKMHPDNGGHYARCPAQLWESHFKPYVLGDVEVCTRLRDRIEIPERRGGDIARERRLEVIDVRGVGPLEERAHEERE